MNAIENESEISQTPHSYFVDETGDGVIFDRKGRLLVGSGKVQDYFILGMIECATLPQLKLDFAELRAQLLADRYFNGVPSLQPGASKTALFFHAKDDLPEVRREVFQILDRHEFSFYAIVRTMSVVVRHVKLLNERDPTYRYKPTELYDSAVRRLFDKKLHTKPAFDVIFASRGKARTQALRAQLLKAQADSHKAAGTFPDAAIAVRAMPSHQHVGLQVTDYCLWALQRLFTKQEDRFLRFIWQKVALIVDADDVAEKSYGTYHTRKKPAMTAESTKNRKVED